jgi:energy-coupling factor transporter transmembrane protein EcfT
MANPIVSFLFYFGLAISIILSKTWTGLGVYYFMSIMLLLLNIRNIKSIIKQVRPFILFLPIFILFYIFISLIFTQSALNQIFNEAGLAISKLLLLVFMMSMYLEISKNHDIILALRSIWSKSNLKWSWIDDLFMFLELTLRFYPTFQQEWQSINRSKIALGIASSSKKWEKVKSTANDLPGIIIQSYLKAENTANVMKQRGYGKVIPRGVAHPISFRILDMVLILILIGSFVTVHKYVTL